VSPARKLFIAAALVVTGLGVAHFLGKPNSLTHALGEYASAIPDHPRVVRNTGETTPGPFVPGNVRLLPQPIDGESTNTTTAPPQPALVSVASPTFPHATPSLLNNPLDQAIASPNVASTQPRAKLRDEAPRPIGGEPRPPAVVRRMPPIGTTSENPAANSTADSSGAMQAGFSNDQQATPAIQTSFDSSSSLSDGSATVSPPPWPALDDDTGPRKHVIVDGDSLAKLAERYLQDARRGHEIFELNRELLASPDLLPIGAELLLPDRSSNLAFDRRDESGVPARNASSGLTPVRPIPLSTGVSPRAQLAAPCPVE
jgi:nucleoid-associated protein YgaU